MKIFVMLSRVPWPLCKGDKLRAFNQIRCLSKSHEIILCALNDDPKLDKETALKELQKYCKSITFIDISKVSIAWNMLRALFSKMPIQCGYFFNKKALKTVHHLIETTQPDALYGQLPRVAPYLVDESQPKTLDYQDVFSMGMKRRRDVAPFWKKPIFNLEYQRLRRYEREIFDRFDVKTIICEADRQHIDHPRRDEILIVPNGVDYDFFQPQEKEPLYDIVFTGNMSYAPNVDAVEYMAYEVLPLVWKELPTTKFYVAGATPDPRIMKTASDRIVISGWLDDIRDAYASSKIFIAPMRLGTGLQNKLLEAMAMRKPCITTPLANDSLKAAPDKEILVGRDAQELATHIINLLKNPSLAQELAQNGNTFVHTTYDWDNSIANLFK